MLRYIDIQSDGTSIERFPIDNSNSLWLAKKGATYGISLNKYDAITQLDITPDSPYAQLGMPRYLNLPGTEAHNNGEMLVFSLPGAGKFVHNLLTLELKQTYHYDTIYCEEVNSTAIICKPTDKKREPFVLHTSQGCIPGQIRRCIYQLYIEMDKGIDFNLQTRDTNIKQRDWINIWYRKLPARGFSL